MHFRSRSLREFIRAQAQAASRRHPIKSAGPGPVWLSADQSPLATQSRRVRIGISTTEFVGIFVTSALILSDAAPLCPHGVVNPRTACHVHLSLYYRRSRVVGARPDQAFGVRCSKVCAIWAYIRLAEKIGVNRSIGLPREWLSRRGLEIDTGL